jgi:hypothetical protein
VARRYRARAGCDSRKTDGRLSATADLGNIGRAGAG